MVRSYVLTPDGHPYAMLDGVKVEPTLAGLQRAVQQFQPKPGNPVVPPAPQSAPPPTGADDISLHLISRADVRDSWGWLPAEDWIVLKREQWSKLLPSGDVKSGDAWELDRNVTARVLTHFYPQTENTHANIERIDGQSLTAKVLAVKDGVVTARVDGFVKMHHAFYPGRKDAHALEAEVVGILVFAPDKPPLLRLATTKALHGHRPFKVAVRTVPPVLR
jgi:hypothetical protein